MKQYKLFLFCFFFVLEVLRLNQENIGRKIAVYRKQMKLTQDQLGEKSSISGKTISKWERGISLPDVFIISKFCDMLNINIKELSFEIVIAWESSCA